MYQENYRIPKSEEHPSPDFGHLCSKIQPKKQQQQKNNSLKVQRLNKYNRTKGITTPVYSFESQLKLSLMF